MLLKLPPTAGDHREKQEHSVWIEVNRSQKPNAECREKSEMYAMIPFKYIYIFLKHSIMTVCKSIKYRSESLCQS